ncbi:MAG TPA: hypothetical protein PKG52_11925, partial [bacterium]|nr:hypothetical protein [bacterium]
MKFLNFLSVIVLSLICLTIASCIQEDADECVNALDCVNGFICLDGVCVDPNSSTGDSDKTLVDNDTAVLLDNDIADTENDDDQLFDFDNNENDMDQTTIPDDEVDEVPDPDTVVECEPGYHLEAEGDDENGDGNRGCVKNVTCISEPCNGGQCTELEFTVTCKCTTGYLKSTVDDKCKPDCDNGTYNCTGSKVCGVDPVKNEAGCLCAQYYSGTDCTICDATHFCSSHGTCSAPSGAPICSCTGNWTGN